MTAFVLERGDEGFSSGPPMRKMGQRAIIDTELFSFAPSVTRARSKICMSPRKPSPSSPRAVNRHAHVVSTGLARAALEYAATYARERVQFGKPIAEHQAVSFRLADMALRVDASRPLVWRAARLLDAGERATAEAAMAKLHASEMAMWCTWAAVQTLGGWGYSR